MSYSGQLCLSYDEHYITLRDIAVPLVRHKMSSLIAMLRARNYSVHLKTEWPLRS